MIESRRNIQNEMRELLKNTDEDNLFLIDDFTAREKVALFSRFWSGWSTSTGTRCR